MVHRAAFEGGGGPGPATSSDGRCRVQPGCGPRSAPCAGCSCTSSYQSGAFLLNVRCGGVITRPPGLRAQARVRQQSPDVASHSANPPTSSATDRRPTVRLGRSDRSGSLRPLMHPAVQRHSRLWSEARLRVGEIRARAWRVTRLAEAGAIGHGGVRQVARRRRRRVRPWRPVPRSTRRGPPRGGRH